MIKLAWLPALSLVAMLLRWLPPAQGGDLFGISRTIDQAVYTMFNSAAVVLWRFNSALLSMSLFSYNTQDWLTNSSDGGVWQVMDIVTGPGGLLGLNAWQALMALAMMMFGMSLLLRPFIKFHPVDVGKAFIYGVLSLAVIQQGSSLMTGIETWRSDLSGYMYQTMADRGSVNIDVPGTTPSSNDPMYPPGDLDGRVPIRGWEAVSTSYFLVTDEQELNNDIPPDDFREAYCLYDPNQPVDDQSEENSAGCSPRKAWDEWDYLGSTGVVTSVWGIDLPITLGYELPIQADHPENRELGIRQAQSGVARLALGPIVALYPLLEANVSLMLAMSAAVLYLTIPIMLLFGFFRFTEPLVTRLLLRFIHIIVNTIILNGLVSLFLLLLINVSVNGSLSAYLGIVGVAVLGGYMLTRVAAGTLKETLSTAMSAVGGVWMTATTGAMGREAAPAARTTLGAAKLVGAGALAGVAGAKMFDMAEGAYHGARSGMRDLDKSGWGATAGLQKQAGQLPTPLARMAQEGLANDDMAGADPSLMPGGTAWTQSPPAVNGGGPAAAQSPESNGSWAGTAAALGVGAGLVGGAVTGNGQNGTQNGRPTPQPDAAPVTARSAAEVIDRYSQQERQAAWDAAQSVRQQSQYTAPDGSLNSAGLQVVADRMSVQGIRAFQSDQGQHELGLLLAAQQSSLPARGWGAPEARQPQLDAWLDDAWQSQQTGQGSGQVQERAQTLFGEQLAADVDRAVGRREQANVEQVVAATRRAAAEMSPAEMSNGGQVTAAGLAAIKADLPAETANAFQGRRGEQDLTALAAAALQQERSAPAAAFREAVAGAQPGQAGRSVPEQLGLDPVAAGVHFSALNRFAQVSNDAGLSQAQRQQLLAETQTGDVTPALRTEIEDSLARQAQRGRESQVTADEVINSALALPPTLSGPELPGSAAVRQAVAEAPAASGETPRMVPLDAAAAGVGAMAGQVDSGTRERLGAAESEAPADNGRTTAAEIRQTAAEAPAASGETPRMVPLDAAAAGVGAMAGQVDSGTRERLGAAESEAPADSGRTTAAEIRQTAAEAPAADDPPQTTAQTDDATSDANSQTKPANVESADSPAADLRDPIPAAAPRAAETAPAAPTSDREPVQPLDAQDQAGAAAAELGRLQQQMTEMQQSHAESVSAGLRRVEETSSAPNPPPPLAAETRPPDLHLRDDAGAGKEEPMSGAEVKAAALAGGSGEARSKLAADAGQPAGNEAGSSVAAAVRRGRTEDAEEDGTADRRSAKSSKKQAAANDDSPGEAEAVTPAAEDAEPVAHETVVSMQPWYRQVDDAAAVDQRPPADQAEVEMDAAADRAAARRPKAQQDAVKAEPERAAGDDTAVAEPGRAAGRAAGAPPVTEAFRETPGAAKTQQPKGKSKPDEVDLSDPAAGDAAKDELPRPAKQSSKTAATETTIPTSAKENRAAADPLPERERPSKTPRPSAGKPDGKGKEAKR